MFSHVCVGCSDLERAAAFYDSLLAPLGLRRRVVLADGGPAAACWVGESVGLPRFYVYRPFNEAAASAGNGSMVAFLASSTAAVQEAHAAGLAAGGCNEGAPGPRPRYGEGYYGAYLRDLDHNKIHLVFRGDLSASPGPRP